MSLNKFARIENGVVAEVVNLEDDSVERVYKRGHWIKVTGSNVSVGDKFDKKTLTFEKICPPFTDLEYLVMILESRGISVLSDMPPDFVDSLKHKKIEFEDGYK